MTDGAKTTKKKKPTVWEVLSRIDVSSHTQEKNGMTFLPWAWAWGVLMEHYPESTFKNHLNDMEYPCFFGPHGNAMVRVTLCVDGVERTEDFPVLDYKNKSIAEPDSFQVNTALKRCLVKCMAYFGLGHYIYAGEDMPQSDDTPPEKKPVAKPKPKPKTEAKPAVEMVTESQMAVIRAEFGKRPTPEARLALRKDLLAWGQVTLPEGIDPENFKLNDIAHLLTRHNAQIFIDRPPF